MVNGGRACPPRQDEAEGARRGAGRTRRHQVGPKARAAAPVARTDHPSRAYSSDFTVSAVGMYFTAFLIRCA